MNRASNFFKNLRLTRMRSQSSNQNKSSEFWNAPEPMIVGALVTLWSVVESANTTHRTNKNTPAEIK